MCATLSVKQAAKNTIAQWKCATFQIIIYLAEEKTSLERAAFWHEVKVVYAYHPTLLLLEHDKVHLWTGEWYFSIFIRNGVLQQQKTDID